MKLAIKTAKFIPDPTTPRGRMIRDKMIAAGLLPPDPLGAVADGSAAAAAAAPPAAALPSPASGQSDASGITGGAVGPQSSRGASSEAELRKKMLARKRTAAEPKPPPTVTVAPAASSHGDDRGLNCWGEPVSSSSAGRTTERKFHAEVYLTRGVFPSSGGRP